MLQPALAVFMFFKTNVLIAIGYGVLGNYSPGVVVSSGVHENNTIRFAN